MMDENLRLIFHLQSKIERLQYEVRLAFEHGYDAARPKSEQSKSVRNPEKSEWFDHWLKSPSRQFLIDNMIISGDEGYK